MVDDEQDLAALLRAAGPRIRAAAPVVAEVRAAAEAEWRAAVAGRRRRQRYTAWAAAAGVGIAAVAVWLARPLYLPANDPVAAFARVEGQVEYRDRSSDGWRPATTAVSLKSGDELRTGSTGRVALQLRSGVDVRLDSDTQFAFEDSSHASLVRGGVYVDSGTSDRAEPRDLEIGTPLGNLQHVGTQYEARLLDQALRVAVREGRVEVRSRGVDVLGVAGEQLTVANAGVTRSALPAHAGQWAWVGTVTPPFAIEGKSVEVFLAWAGRETGRSIVYASPAVARQAHDILLRGSVAGLTPEQAVQAVLSTTPLRPGIEGDRIRIE